MRVLGVDYGLRRIGLAIGETEVKMAFAREVLPATGSVSGDASVVFSILISGSKPIKQNCRKNSHGRQNQNQKN